MNFNVASRDKCDFFTRIQERDIGATSTEIGEHNDQSNVFNPMKLSKTVPVLCEDTI